MCLQDYQLARAALTEVREFSVAAIDTALMLPSNPQRVGLLVTGPSAGNLDLYIGVNATRRHFARIVPNTTGINRHLDIFEIGVEITDSIFYVTDSAMDWTVFEYSLPLDPASLQRLALTGKW